NASRIAPEPVPRSAIRGGLFAARLARSSSSASSTTVSVSGRGTSVSAESLSGSPQNSLVPRIRATGSPPRRRRTKPSRHVDSFAQGFARDDLRQFIERQVDTVVGDAALRKIIGADALGAVAGADLLAAIGRARGLDALALGVVDARAQDVHRRRPVLVLRPAVLHADHDTGRDVGDADRRFGLVDMLAAGAL